MKTIVFDIETGPLPEQELQDVIPPFNEMDVKLGNLKDPEKIKEKIESARQSHYANAVSEAALNATTGRVLAIGYSTCQPGAGVNLLASGDEVETLSDFWQLWSHHCTPQMQAAFIGFNIFRFDLPFLIRRSWHHGVPVPLNVRKGRYWNDFFVDLYELWSLGEYRAHGGLDAVARFLGVGQKNGSGKDFAALFFSDRKAAEEYLINDVKLTVEVAKVLHGLY